MDVKARMDELYRLVEYHANRYYNDDDPEMLFSAPEPNGNFSVSDTHVTWIYNPYEIAPYAMGSIELSVSWNDLKPYLK